MSGPIAADGGGPLERDQIARQFLKAGPERTSSKSIGRGRSICEYDEIMQILPGSSDNTVLINAPLVICNLATVRAFSSEVETVRAKKTRQIKNLEPRFDFIETEKALVRRFGRRQDRLFQQHDQ